MKTDNKRLTADYYFKEAAIYAEHLASEMTELVEVLEKCDEEALDAIDHESLNYMIWKIERFFDLEDSLSEMVIGIKKEIAQSYED